MYGVGGELLNGIKLEGGEWRLLGILYANILVLCSEFEDYLKVIVGCFVEVCKRGYLKVSADDRKLIMLGGEEGSICKVLVMKHLEHVSELKYLGCLLNESNRDSAK